MSQYNAATNPNALVCGGIVGLCVYGSVFFIVLWRISVLRICGEQFGYKIRFHILVLLAVVCGLIYFLSLVITNRYVFSKVSSPNITLLYSYVQWGYPFYVLSFYINVLAFSQVVLFWSRSFEFGLSYQTMEKLVTRAMIVNGFFAIPAFCVLCYNLTWKWAELVSYLMGAFNLVLFASWMLVYGVRLQTRLANYQMSTSGTVKRTALIRELLRINMILLVVVGCALFRAAVEITVCLLQVSAIHDDDSFLKEVSMLEWIIVTVIIPQILPVGNASSTAVMMMMMMTDVMIMMMTVVMIMMAVMLID